MVGGTIRRKRIHRESFRASVLHHSENQAVLQSIAANTCLLTTPSFLSRATPGLLRAQPDRRDLLLEGEGLSWYYSCVRNETNETRRKGVPPALSGKSISSLSSIRSPKASKSECRSARR